MVDTTTLNYLPDVAGWERVPQLEDGFWPTGGPVDPANDTGLMNWQAKVLAARTAYLKERVEMLAQRAAIEVTVGAGGQFATVNDALAHLSDRRPGYVPGGFQARVRLQPGFVLREQVIVSGVNLGWIRIVSSDAEVQIDRTYLTRVVGDGHYPAFAAGNGGYLPVIDALFTMMTTGPGANRHGVYVFEGGGATIAAGRGVKAAGGNGVMAQTSGVISANDADFRNAAEGGAVLAGGTRAALQGAILSGCAIGIDAGNGAAVHAALATCSGCRDFGIRAQNGAVVNAGNVNARKGASDSASDIAVFQGATVNAVGATGGTSVTPNTISPQGIIFK